MQRRQHCVNFCSFLLAPLLLVAFAQLGRILENRSIDPLKVENVIDQTNPTVSFAARPFNAGICPLLESEDADSKNSVCLNDPFQPKPFEIPIAIADSVDSGKIGKVEYAKCQGSLSSGTLCRDLITAGAPRKEGSGLMENLSLEPFINPLLVENPGRCQNATNQYNCVFRHAVLDPDALSEDDQDVYSKTIDQFYNTSLALAKSKAFDNVYRTSTKPFSSRGKMLDHIFDEWEKSNVIGKYFSAYYIKEFKQDEQEDSTTLDATIYFNDSVSGNCTKQCDLTSSVIHLSNAVFKSLNSSGNATAYLRQFPQVKRRENLGFIQLVISVFLGLFYHFLFPSFLRFLVYERSSRLRDMMELMGLRRINYWVATYLGLLLQYGIFAIVLMVIGLAINSVFYRENAIIAYVSLFFIWGNVLVAFAIFLAPFFQKPEPALIFGWSYVIVVTFLGSPFLGRLLASDEPESTWYAVQLLPSFAFMRSIYYMGAFNVGGKGVTVGDEFFAGENLNMCGPGPLCRSYVFLVIQWVLLLVFGLYFDRVLPGATGIRDHPLYFLGFKRFSRGKGGSGRSSTSGDLEGNGDNVDEKTRGISGGSLDRGVVVDNLTKVYHGKPPFKAVSNLSFTAKHGEVFGLLGANGSGKTTTFRVLTGELEPTSGDVYMNGLSVRTDMRIIRQQLALCPQHDRHWRDLSGEEHLYFYARLKAPSGVEVKKLVDDALKSVQLTFARKRKVNKYSGGMKRRLSVAISFITKPSIVVMDEPTTGQDPRSRQRVWDCIQQHKNERTIVLTTHSLEEAETCDRVAILAHGQLQCIGSPDELRVRYGRGYRVTFSLPESKMGDLHQMMTELSIEATFEGGLSGNVTYMVPKSVALSAIFAQVEGYRERLALRDWGVSQSSLEDVFVDITKQEARRLEQAQDHEV